MHWREHVQKGINISFKTIKIDCTDRTYQSVKCVVEKVGLSQKIFDKTIVFQINPTRLLICLHSALW
jgi:hypothetical protein